MSRMLVAVAAATVALIAVAPAPALSGGRSLAATATAAVTAAAFALCATALRRPLLAAVVVLCGPLLKVTAVTATAAEGPAAAIASDAMAEDAALSAFVAVVVAMFLFVAPSGAPRVTSAPVLPTSCIAGEDLQRLSAHRMDIDDIDYDERCTERWMTEAACTGLWLAFGIFAGLLLAATVLAVPAVPSAIAPFVAAIVVLIAIVAVSSASALENDPYPVVDHHVEVMGYDRLEAETDETDSADSVTAASHSATAPTTTEESCRQRCMAALAATRPDFPTLLALFAIVAVAVVTTCDFAVVSDDVASLVLRCDAGMFLFGATEHESTAVDGVAVSLLRLLTLTCVLPLMVASLAGSFRMEIEEEEDMIECDGIIA